ncbi:hypothetical protein MA16_Dca004972 [Dendrobium catenatum]|uniref:Uncharacterized protein n=1 Tax=Dendrobium catenatum TaxID=906689 RepID=A0A2I0WGK2_9ASPA|nr:hypothetical protein MA16_Dca004972 [Dendrobium catenatum]
MLIDVIPWPCLVEQCRGRHTHTVSCRYVACLHLVSSLCQIESSSVRVPPESKPISTSPCPVAHKCP